LLHFIISSFHFGDHNTYYSDPPLILFAGGCADVLRTQRSYFVCEIRQSKHSKFLIETITIADYRMPTLTVTIKMQLGANIKYGCCVWVTEQIEMSESPSMTSVGGCQGTAKETPHEVGPRDRAKKGEKGQQ
jgi:hypothetical protein